VFTDTFLVGLSRSDIPSQTPRNTCAGIRRGSPRRQS